MALGFASNWFFNDFGDFSQNFTCKAVVVVVVVVSLFFQNQILSFCIVDVTKSGGTSAHPY